VVSGLFPSGDELLARYEELRPSLVLMDIHIKGSRDGVETASLLHERWQVPVILLTAYADEETIARAKLTQPFGYILKPFEERELKTAIEIALYRASMEQKLRQSEARYRRLFQEGLSGNFLTDREGRIVEANAAFRHIFGIGADAPLPELPSLFPDRAAWQSFRAGLSASRSLELAEFLLRSPGGKDILVFANVALFLDERGEESGIQGELSDLTERRRLEERLGQAQRMEAVGKLAGGIAHDFNNILTAIIGYANLLEDSARNGEAIKDDIEGITKAAAKATSLTRQLLAFSRQQKVSPRTLETNDIVKDMEKMLRRILGEEIALSLSLDAGTPAVFADPSQVEQVLVNLVVNAKDAMPEGGRIQILTRLERIRVPRNVGMDTLPAGDYAVIIVRDTGTGIKPEILNRIFEPFFTTKPKDKGTGLGLSMVYGIAKQNGGGVEVSSSPGAGATFAVWVPAAPRQAEVVAEEAPERLPAAVRPCTILFVDDDEELRKLAERLLGRLGHRVIPAANAGEAILIAEGQGRPIDLLVSDVVMPLMDGYTLARRLTVMLPGLKVLFVSGYSERAADGESQGRFLAKPFTEAQLADAVGKALAEAGPEGGAYLPRASR
jgi:PAS domain S-box-containing protein